jgi:hypothetical protein
MHPLSQTCDYSDICFPKLVIIAEGNPIKYAAGMICRKLHRQRLFAGFLSFSNALSIALTFYRDPRSRGSCTYITCPFAGTLPL